MASAQCSNHGTVEAVWKEVTSKKDGKQYKFWSCPKQEKDQFGNYIKCKVEVANTPSGKFDQALSKSATQMDNGKRDDTITRLAICKSMIEVGYKPSLDTWKEANQWLDWATGKSVANMVKAPAEQPIAAVPKMEADEMPNPFL